MFTRNSLFPNAKAGQARPGYYLKGRGQVMNPDRRYGFFCYLLEQVRGH
jgi:hypothetical protein